MASTCHLEVRKTPLTIAQSRSWMPVSSVSPIGASLASLTRSRLLAYRRDKPAPTCIHPTFPSQTQQNGETSIHILPTPKNQTCDYGKGESGDNIVFYVLDRARQASPKSPFHELELPATAPETRKNSMPPFPCQALGFILP